MLDHSSFQGRSQKNDALGSRRNDDLEVSHTPPPVEWVIAAHARVLRSAIRRLTDFSSIPAAAPLPVPDTQSFTYDLNGNRESLTEDGTPYSYTNVAYSNRLSSTAGPTAKTYSYDAAGNVTSDAIHSYGYDDRGRLVSVDSGAATYTHNAGGQRVKKDVGGTVTLFAYDEQGRLIGEYDAQGNPLMEHVWFDGRPVAALRGSTVYQVDTDHLGTPRIISEGYAGAVWTWLSDPFGSTPDCCRHGGPLLDQDGHEGSGNGCAAQSR